MCIRDRFDLTRENLRIRPQSAEIEEEEIEAEILRRKDAKVEKDYATSDAIRATLAAKGVEVMDGDPLGWEWKLDWIFAGAVGCTVPHGLPRYARDDEVSFLPSLRGAKRRGNPWRDLASRSLRGCVPLNPLGYGT